MKKQIMMVGICSILLVACLSGCEERHPFGGKPSDSDQDSGDTQDISEGFQSNEWQDAGMVFQVTADELYWNPEVVQLDNGTYRMYCECSIDNGQSWNIVVLTSPDGINWTLVGTALGNANMPTIVKLSDGRWRLYFNDFESGSTAGGFGSAISSGGLSFEREEGLRLSPTGDLESYGIRHPSVVALDEGGFRLYYEGQGGSKKINRIFSAYSIDGINFTRDGGTRIDATSVDEWMSASSCSVLRTPDGIWRLYYSQGYNQEANAGTSSFQKTGIYLAWSTDGLNFSLGTEPEIGCCKLDDGKNYAPVDPTVLVVKEGSKQVLRMWYYTQTLSDEFGQYSGMFLANKDLDDLSST